ncbi:MAG: GreA/GreB family elongation factor [Selenomonadaceae bacterium]|nr:GreA/GreB family elongation factor [Selenomonadaceae bacterium]
MRRFKLKKDGSLVNDEPNIDRTTGAMPGQHNRGSSKRQNLDRWHEAELSNAHSQTVKPSANLGKIVIGSTVTVCDVELDLTETFMIVGSTGAAPDKNKISCKSPLGAALLGKTAGMTIQVPAPKGILNFKILKIK